MKRKFRDLRIVYILTGKNPFLEETKRKQGGNKSEKSRGCGLFFRPAAWTVVQKVFNLVLHFPTLSPFFFSLQLHDRDGLRNKKGLHRETP